LALFKVVHGSRKPIRGVTESLRIRKKDTHFERRKHMQHPNTPLERQVVSILGAHREGAYGTQRARSGDLARAAQALHERFGLQKWANLGAKHVAFLVEKWKAEDTRRRSIDAQLTHFRWLVRKLGKANLMPRSNLELGVEPGPRYTRAGKFVVQERLLEILGGVAHDPRRRMAVLLGRYLGLRMREAMLFRPWRDWEESGRIWLKRGTKGGRPRYLFLWNARQREILEEARALVHGQDAALIPEEAKTWEQWRQASYHKLRKAGLSKKADTVFHDLRRTYAGERMHYLIKVRGLDQDHAERIVTRELGHSRREVLRWYLEDQHLIEAEQFPTSRPAPSGRDENRDCHFVREKNE
jgi:site-specific recombinase XerC